MFIPVPIPAARLRPGPLFLGKKQEDLLGIGVFGDPGLNEAVRKDALGIGFNNINYAYRCHYAQAHDRDRDSAH